MGLWDPLYKVVEGEHATVGREGHEVESLAVSGIIQKLFPHKPDIVIKDFAPPLMPISLETIYHRSCKADEKYQEEGQERHYDSHVSLMCLPCTRTRTYARPVW